MPVNQDGVRAQYRTTANFDARVQLHERFSTAKQPWMEWVFDQLDLPGACRLLEVGAGTGSLWRDNARRIPPGWEITISDLSPGMLERARQNLAAQTGRYRFALIDATSIPYGAGEFDAVVANHMLYHVPELDITLREMRRVLKPGGSLYAATNSSRHMQELRDLIPPFIPFDPVSDVIGQFTLEDGRQALEVHFPDVRLLRMANDLLVTEAAPLVAYILSRITLYAPARLVDEAQRQALAAHVEGRLREQGGRYRITKDTGMFVAKKAETPLP